MSWKRVFISLWAISILGLLEYYALSLGINGLLFSGVVALIAGIAGYTAKAAKEAKNDARK